MQALVIGGPNSVALKDVPAPNCGGECRIRVTMAGICGTDLQLLEGYAEFRGIPGHEFVGTVEAVSDAADEKWLGKRVVGEINIGCGRCTRCESGVKEHCANRNVLGIRGRDGAFAEMLCLPAANLHEVPAAMPDATAVFVEPVAAACRILQQVEVRADSQVAVIGDGRLALLIAQVLKTVTPEVTILGRHAHKLEIARTLGLTAGRSGTATPGTRFPMVVDATGRREGLQHALEIVEPRGTIVMKSTFHGESDIAAWPVVVNEVTLVGSRCGPFAQAIELLASGAVNVEPLVSRIAALDEFESAFADARRALKVLFDLRARIPDP